jgi:hypothetical protein
MIKRLLIYTYRKTKISKLILVINLILITIVMNKNKKIIFKKNNKA